MIFPDIPHVPNNVAAADSPGRQLVPFLLHRAYLRARHEQGGDDTTECVVLPVHGVSVAEGARAVVADAIRRDPETWNDAILGYADIPVSLPCVPLT